MGGSLFSSPSTNTHTPLAGILLSNNKVSLFSCSAQEPPFPVFTFLKDKKLEQNKLFSLALSAVKALPPYLDQEDLGGKMLQAEWLLRPTRDLLGLMADFNQFPGRVRPCCLEDSLTGFPTSVLSALPVCLCQLRKGRGVFFSGS